MFPLYADQKQSTTPVKGKNANKTTKVVVKTASAKHVAVGNKQLNRDRQQAKKVKQTTAMEVSSAPHQGPTTKSTRSSVNPKKTPAVTTPSKAIENTTGSTPLERAIQTARSIVNNPKHVKHSDVKTLLDSYQKGWISEEKFIDILKSLLFV